MILLKNNKDGYSKGWVEMIKGDLRKDNKKSKINEPLPEINNIAEYLFQDYLGVCSDYVNNYKWLN